MALAALAESSVAPAAPIAVSLQHFELAIRVDYAEERIDGTARLTVKNASDNVVTQVPLLLNRLMTVTRAAGADGSALKVDQDVVLFDDDTKLQVDAADVALASPLGPGKSTTIAIDYGGHLAGYTETGALYIKDHISDEFTIIREDAYAFPGIGVPSRRVNRARPRGDFTFDVRVNVPAGFIPATGGTLTETKESDGRTTFRFTSDVPASFVNIGIAKYKTLDAGGVRIYYFPADEAGAKNVLDRTQQALRLFEQWLGPLPQPPKFTIVEIPEHYGPQASLVSGIILEATVFRDPDYLYSLYHEMGHFWNVPNKDVPSPRWNEGLSTWYQEIVPEAIDQKRNEGFAPWMVKRAQEGIHDDQRLQRVPLKDYGKEEMTDYAYSVGYLYLRILDSAIGREALLSALHDYFQQYKLTGGTLSEFTALLERRYPIARAIDADWIETTAWTKKLAQAKSVDELAAAYKTSIKAPQ